MIIRLFEHFTCRKRLYIVKFPIDLCCAKYFVMSRSWYICFLLGTIGMALSLGGCSSGDKEKSRRSVVVETITLVPSDNSYTDSFVGSVEESSAAALSFAVGGQVKRVLVTEGDRVILNLASKEYSRCVEKYLQPEDRFITCVFGELSDGKVKQKGTFAKMARGEMVRFLAERRAEDPEEAKGFDRLGYRFSEEFSGEDEIVFLRKPEE